MSLVKPSDVPKKKGQAPVPVGSKPKEKKHIESKTSAKDRKQERTAETSPTKSGTSKGRTNEDPNRAIPNEPEPDYNQQEGLSQRKNSDPKSKKTLERKQEKKQQKKDKAKLEDFQKRMKSSLSDWTHRFGKRKANETMESIKEMERLLQQFEYELRNLLQNDESQTHNLRPATAPSGHYRDDRMCHDREGPDDHYLQEKIDSQSALYPPSQQKIKSSNLENPQLPNPDVSHERPPISTNGRSEDSIVENKLRQKLDQYKNRIIELQQVIQDSEDKLTAALSSSHGQDQRMMEQASSRDDEVLGRNQSRPSSFPLPEKVDKLIDLYRFFRDRVDEPEIVESHTSDSNVTQQRPKTSNNHKSKRDLEKENEQLYQKLNKYKQYNMQLKGSVEEREQKLKMVLTSLTKVEREKEEALSRLSEIAGRRLRENNAAIADLSTENRPTKIAEKYKELYDNEWTDALAEMGNQKISDQDAIAGLLEILMEAYDFCTKQAEHQYTQLTALETYFDRKEGFNQQVVTLELSRDAQELAKQFRKSASTTVVSLIQNAFMGEKKKRSNQMGPDTEKFCRKCVEITWYMSVQLPPMALDDMPPHGDVINLDRYAYYTKSGTVVDFVVWPACMIQKDGALLAKGILQPKASHSEKYTSRNGDKEKKDKKGHIHEASKPSLEQITTKNTSRNEDKEKKKDDKDSHSHEANKPLQVTTL